MEALKVNFLNLGKSRSYVFPIRTPVDTLTAQLARCRPRPLSVQATAVLVALNLLSPLRIGEDCPLPLSMLPAQLTGAAAIDNCAD